MTWFKVDDQFYSHPKVDALDDGPCADSALRLWTIAGSWASQHLTDGHIPGGRARRLSTHPEAADELVRVGLWETTDQGFCFHDWLDYNPSAEKVEEKRDGWRARKAKSRSAPAAPASPRESRRDIPPGHGVTHAVTTPDVTAGHAEESRRESRGGHAPPDPVPDPVPDPHSHNACARADSPGSAGGCEAPEPQPDGPRKAGPEPCPPDEHRRAELLLLEGYQRRYEAATSEPWMGKSAKRNADAMALCATWAISKGPEEIEARVERLLSGMFADSWMRSNSWPWGRAAQDPAKFGSAAQSVAADLAAMSAEIVAERKRYKTLVSRGEHEAADELLRTTDAKAARYRELTAEAAA